MCGDQKLGLTAVAARRPVVAAATLLDAPPRTARTHQDPLEQKPAAAASVLDCSTSQPASQPLGKSKWAIDESEVLKSNLEHRLWTFGSMAIMAATLYHATAQAGTVLEWTTIGVSLFAAYVLSDLGTGIYHWSVDNYGDGTTPLVGKQIAAFQGHHQRPWTITQREFCNNVHMVFKPAAFPAALFLALSPYDPLWCDAFFSSFIFFVCMSQQFHAWSHMKKSELPEAVLWLQDANILISRKAHGAHHRAPFEGNYCIVSGWWNGILDNSGFFRGLERLVHAVTGVEPRCWYEPEYEVEEESTQATVA